jgi:pimeloyl-ACP methyl ester carboxylesterase
MLRRVLRVALALLILIAAAVAVGYGWRTYADARNLAEYPAPGQLIDVSGRNLHLLCEGTGDGPTVIMETGLGDAGANLWPLQHEVARFARVCTYDRAGYAWSDAAPVGRTMQAVADDLGALVAGADLPGPYVLVAHSLGGFYVRLFARDHANDVAGIVLIDSSEEGSNLSEEGRAMVPSMTMLMSVAGWSARVGLLPALLKVLGQETPADMPANAVAMNLRPSQLAAAHDEIAATLLLPPEMQAPGGFGALGDLPLVVLSHDPNHPDAPAEEEATWVEAQERLAALSTGSERIVATGSGHYIYRDRPDLVVDAIRRVFEAARDGAPLKAGAAASR